MVDLGTGLEVYGRVHYAGAGKLRLFVGNSR